MFLRRHRKVVEEVNYDYWTLRESHRTASGPRQRVVATLGKLDSAELADEAGWEDLGALLEGRALGKKARQAGLGGSPETAATQPAAQWEAANVAALRVERVRDFGEVWLGLALWHRLGLGKLIGSLVEPGKEEVPWADIAAVLTVARFCAQRSELGIAEHWYGRTALEDITGVPLSKINDDRLYRGLDVLGAHKDRLCGHLMERYRDWFVSGLVWRAVRVFDLRCHEHVFRGTGGGKREGRAWLLARSAQRLQAGVHRPRVLAGGAAAFV